MSNDAKMDWDVPMPKSKSQFMKNFESGDNKFRVLAPPITGFEGWTEVDGKNKPIRWSEEPSAEEIAEYDIRPDENSGKPKIKGFVAYLVWNYAEACYQVLSITQKSVIKLIDAYRDNEEYGKDLSKYDITVTKKGDGLNTDYTVVASPPKAISKDIADEVAEGIATCNLDAMYDGEYPFD